MPITKPVGVNNLFRMRDRLVDAAELSVDAKGKVNVQKLPADLRAQAAVIAQADKVSLSEFKSAVDKALAGADVFDVGENGGRDVPATGGCGTVTSDDTRVGRFRRDHEPAPERPGFFSRLVNGSPGETDLELDEAELARLRELGTAEAQALVALTQSVEGGLSPEVLEKARALLPDVKSMRFDEEPVSRVVRFSAPAGATKGVEAVRVHDRAKGEWITAKVKADGSFSVDLGQPEGDVGIWFDPKGKGDFVYGGSVNAFYLGGSPRKASEWLSEDGVVRALATSR